MRAAQRLALATAAVRGRLELAPPAPSPPPSGGPAVAPADLHERHERLTRRYAELQWDLGGLVYEMAARDHFRLDVVNRVAARLQELDAELGQVERLAHLDGQGAAGECGGCGAMHARGACYCWRCGQVLLELAEPPEPTSIS